MCMLRSARKHTNSYNSAFVDLDQVQVAGEASYQAKALAVALAATAESDLGQDRAPIAAKRIRYLVVP